MKLEGRLPTAIDERQASELARDLYGFEATARALPGEYDDNFHLVAPDGSQRVLKVMHPARERSLIDLQCAALEHIAERAPHLTLPRVCRTLHGAAIAGAQVAGVDRLVWMLTYVPGRMLAEARPHTTELLGSLGRLLGEVDHGLFDFSHPAADRPHLKWDLARAAWIRDVMPMISNPPRRTLVERALDRFEAEVVPALPRLRRSVIYGDANDYNVIVGDPLRRPREVSVIDFGDMHRGLTVSEPAIAAAYALLGKPDPLAAAAEVVRGYHAACSLDETEIALLHTLIAARLAVSVTNSALMKTKRPDDPYVTISEAPAWEALERWLALHPRLAHYRFRDACGRPPVPQASRVAEWLATQAAAALLPAVDLRTAPSLILDLSVGSRLLGADPSATETGALTRTIFGAMERAGVAVAVGRYDEARLLYSSALFGGEVPIDERRTVHLGIDLFVAAGATIHAPLDGVVHVLANNPAPLDYGPLVILRHTTGGGEAFFTLYGHLSRDTLDGLAVGQRIGRGQPFARVGTPDENGGWPPHLHFQVILDLLERDADFPGIAYAGERTLWTGLSPDPNRLLGIPAGRFPPAEWTREATLAARRESVGPSVRLSYRRPLKIVRGFMQYLYDETGRAFLDVYNNVPLVGHGHPRVVRAAQEQLGVLNTNTRYLHDNIVAYAERLTRLLPDALRVCFFVNSGSEANELALRLARTCTGREDVIVLEHSYHGHTATLIDVSPYKFDGPGGRGRKPGVHVAPLPDDYRGRYRRSDPEAGRRYAAEVGAITDRLRADGRGLAAFLAESMPSTAGQVVFPPGYLAEAYRHVRAAGALCIADEVQTGFARLGTHLWGFETQGVVPDILVLGKPIGNGFPLGAVVTTREIATAFDNGMEFFSTFGGNPVACAAGLAVLDVLEQDALQARARRVGEHLLGALRDLQDRRALIGDVRGSGLFLGVELVRDRATLEPATDEAAYVVERLRERGVLAGTDGPFANVLKLRPPLIFSELDASLFVRRLDEVLAEDAVST
jgi:4-aminobutyrate aminotransferase-like enzyme/Ser/Thr protein kinase RdoA (MazF antagonist)/murein DD-endopeptidase MepM/ murein hydrolase activator NlpD